MRVLGNSARSCLAVVDGVKLHWSEQGEGRPLVILHGLADSQRSWAPVGRGLATKYRVLCLDLPGCGLSDRPDASYGIDWQARLVAAWLEAIGVDQFDVVGHSYGGGVALWLLLHRARSIGKMVLIAPGGLGVEVSVWLRAAAVFGLFEAGGQRMIGAITRLLLHRYGGSLSVSERRMLCRFNDCPGTARAFGRTVRDVIGWRGQTRQVRQHLHQLDELPSIALFWGERDRVIPVSHARALGTLFENCSFWSFPTYGHFMHWQAPDALAEALLGYLNGPERGRSRVKPTSTRQAPQSSQVTLGSRAYVA